MKLSVLLTYWIYDKWTAEQILAGRIAIGVILLFAARAIWLDMRTKKK
jgi:hypothetical protein